MASNSDSSGRVSIDITFEAGTDPDIAQVQVQNRLKDGGKQSAASGAAAGCERG